jgi:hypothetical protein
MSVINQIKYRITGTCAPQFGVNLQLGGVNFGLLLMYKQLL